MRRKLESQRGTVLMVAMILVLLMAGLAVAYVAVTGSQAMNTYVSYKSDRALYLAEAGLADAMFDVQNGGTGEIKSELCGGVYSVTAVPEGTQNLVITSMGAFAETERTIEIVAYDGVHPIFRHAIFAGDSDDDPDYQLTFGGTDDGANQRWQDEVYGPVYSGEDIVVEGDAEMNGDLEAEGDIIGAEGTRTTIPIPDIAGMDYPNNHDINVNQEFADNGYWSSLRSEHYGQGDIVPEDNPAHVFHKNPSDRAAECGMTPGDDFFMEDVYEECPQYNTRVSIAPGGNDQIYFIDGDLWIHNKNTYSFQLKNPDSHITVVVQGSIHIADDFHYHNDVKSGVAFIAIKAPDDPNGEYTGNIYVGDPIFGTVQEINGFLYAENNFIDENLDEGGSAEFYINGIMTAGNHVVMNRDYTGSGYWTGAYPHRRWVPTSEEVVLHSKMIVELDDRVFTGELVLPGLPEINPGTGDWVILAWRETS